jgi:hypothetical protein
MVHQRSAHTLSLHVVTDGNHGDVRVTLVREVVFERPHEQAAGGVAVELGHEQRVAGRRLV